MARISRKAQDKLNTQYADALHRVLTEEMGVVRVDEWYEYEMDTRAGRLALSVRPNATTGATCFARFMDVARANEVFGEWHHNPFTGKWNHSYFDGTPKQAAESLKRHLSSVSLPVVP